MRNNIECEVLVDGNLATVSGPGELTAATSPQLHDKVLNVIASGQVDKLVYDLEQVDFVDATGLGTILDIHIRSAEADKPLTLTNPGPQVQKILELTGLTRVFNIES